MMTKRHSRSKFYAHVPALLVIGICVGLLPCVARAQNGGEITGTVTDLSGAVIPNVDVKITSLFKDFQSGNR